jgi:hypothetical protein
MLSPALCSRSWVISGHPRDLGSGLRVAIFAIVDGTMLKNECETGRESSYARLGCEAMPV